MPLNKTVLSNQRMHYLQNMTRPCYHSSNVNISLMGRTIIVCRYLISFEGLWSIRVYVNQCDKCLIIQGCVTENDLRPVITKWDDMRSVIRSILINIHANESIKNILIYQRFCFHTNYYWIIWLLYKYVMLNSSIVAIIIVWQLTKNEKKQ